MVLLQKVSLTFKKDDPAAKAVFGGGVINALRVAAATTDNPFKNLPLPIDELETANDGLIKSGAAAETGAYTDIEAFEAAEEDWDKKFTLTANYVSHVASLYKETAHVIRRAGFTPTKDAASPTPLPPASDSFTVSNNGKKGAIVAKCQNRISNTQGYVFAALTDGVTAEFNDNVMKITVGTETVYIVVETRLKAELYNLPQVPLNLFVYGFNAAGSGPACQPVKIIPGILHI